MSTFLNRAQVRVWLAGDGNPPMPPARFAALRKGELKDKGFPEPTFGATPATERWDLEELELWRRSQITAELRALADRPTEDPDVAAAEMDRRAEALAQGRTRH